MKVKIGDITKIKTGKLDANASSEDGEYPFFTCSKEPLRISTYSYDCECVLVAGNGDLNVKYYNGKFDAYQRTYIIEDNSDGRLFMPYLYYFMEGYVEKLRKQAIGGVIKYIKLGNLTDAMIELPDVEIQKKIVNILSKTKGVLDSRSHQIDMLDNLIKARFVEMFGDPVINQKGYKKEALQEHAEVLVGYPFKSEGYSEDGIGIVGGYNLMQGFIKWGDCKFWPKSEGYEQYLLNDNDIVVAMDRPWVNGGLKIASVDGKHLPALLIQRTACIRGIDVEQEFLYALLNSNWFADHCNITGSLVPHISNKDISSYEIILPSIEEQKEYVKLVRLVNKSKVVVQKAFDETQMLYDSLLQEFFG